MTRFLSWRADRAATEPETIPPSTPTSSARRAEIASYTDPGCTQRFPERIARKRSRRSVQFIVSHPLLIGGILHPTSRLHPSALRPPRTRHAGDSHLA